MVEPGYEYVRGETLISVADLHKTYVDKDGKDVPILRGVNFDIVNLSRAGKVTGQVDALLAPSGMGKTQLFRCIAGLQSATSGNIFMNHHAEKDASGNDVLRPVQMGEVGVVAQNYPLFNHMTVWNNLMIAATIKMNREDATKVVTDLLERFGLTARKSLYPHQLSGGQQQRVAIIQQIVCTHGKLLLMDEPFSGLDPLVKLEVQHLITEVASQDELNSVIITTHDVDSAIAVADTILLLGREKDASGAFIPGAFIKYSYNLIDLGLAWHPDIYSIPAFRELEKEILALFKEL